LASAVWMVTLLSLTGCNWMSSGPKSSEPKFEALSAEDSVRLERQRAVVAKAVEQRYGVAKLSGTKDDLPILQRLVDDHVFTKSQTYELQLGARVESDGLRRPSLQRRDGGVKPPLQTTVTMEARRGG